ncbi:MAG: protease HtpX [Proteobacteria bacterium]|nr:protease HtpX [Pseudomonadota bacterium]
MAMFKRISLFLITNVLVLVTVSIAFSIIAHFFGLNQSANYMTYTLVFCAVWGMGGAFISLFISKWMAKRAMGVQIIDQNVRDPQLREVVDMVHNMSRRAGLPKMPEVGVYDSPEINAFATGPSKSNSLVAVSTGLLRAMNKEEVEGVIGHEVAHIANGDMVTMTLIQGIVNAFVMFFARILANVISSQVDERYRGIVHLGLVIVLDIVFAILGSVVVNYFSRQREFRADYGGAKYAGREKMIAGLVKLKNQFQMIEPDNGGTATLKISNKSSGIMALFSTHPSLDERIRRLERASIS